nr:protein gamete expressed 1 [Quercus suber]
MRCSEIIVVDEKRSRFAWHLSYCFQKDSGRQPFPSCDLKFAIAKCLKGLSEDQYQNSNEIHDSLNSIDTRIQQVALTTKNVGDHIDVILKHSKVLYEQSKELAASQSELQEGQVAMRRNLVDGMTMLKDSYNILGQEIDNLRNEAIEIERGITKVADAMSIKMENLQSKADDIGNMAVISLDKQQQLLDEQSMALEGLQILTEFQSEALEESRSTLQQFAEYSHKQQEELLRPQEQLQRVHDHLMENSKSILAAQESFESKQASMFIVLDNLFALHNAMLLESRVIKAFFVYCISSLIIYMFTSTKQTYKVRPRLYIRLCATFIIEVAILRLATNENIEWRSWIINLTRSLFVLLASIQILHAICTYRDFEVLNHQMLLTLIEKINDLDRHK